MGGADRRATLFVLLLALVFYWPTWVALENKWSEFSGTGAYAHGYLIAAISFLLMLSNANRVSVSYPRARIITATVLLGASFLWLIASISNLLIVQAVVLPVVLFAAFALIFGPHSAAIFVFPLAFFYFAVPFWEVLIPFLQGLTILMTGHMLAAIGVVAFIEGSRVYISSGTFEIASGCAGLNFFVAAFALGSLYSYLNIRTVRYRIACVGIVLLAAMVTNWIRVTTVIFAGEATQMKHFLIAVDHYRFGWILFAVMLFPLWFVGQAFERKDRRLLSNDRSSSGRSDCSGDLPSVKSVALALALLALMPIVGMALNIRSTQLVSQTIQLPQKMGTWIWHETGPQAWSVSFAGPVEQRFGMYQVGDSSIHVYVNLYFRQDQSRELINSTNRLFDPTDVRIDSKSIEQIQLESGGQLDVRLYEMISRHGGERHLMLYWYQVGSESRVVPIEVKWLELWQRLTGVPASGVIALKVICDVNCNEAGDLLHEFVSRYAAVVGASAFELLTVDGNIREQ